MSEVTIIWIDLAKRVFQLHGAHDDGSVVFRKKLSLDQIQFLYSLLSNPHALSPQGLVSRTQLESRV